MLQTISNSQVRKINKKKYNLIFISFRRYSVMEVVKRVVREIVHTALQRIHVLSKGKGRSQRTLKSSSELPVKNFLN